MDEINNDFRAELALEALQVFVDRCFSSPADRDLSNQDAFEQALSDLLGDLAHAADRVGNDAPGEMFHRCLHRGGGHYQEELREEQERGAPSPPALHLVSDEDEAESGGYGDDRVNR